MRKRIEELLTLADIRINGDRPWDLHVHNEKFYARVLGQGEMGLGESYMDGWWDCAGLDEFLNLLLRARLDEKVKSKITIRDLLQARLFNLQNRRRSFAAGKHHYDIGNDLFQCMLDKRMIYSCGYWKGASTLDEAQENKLDLICDKLRLEPGMRVLDVGCGWGGTAKYLSERCGVEVVGVTVSMEQTRMAQETCGDLPVRFLYKDYRDVDGEFDRILSIGMFEHVGARNYRTFMETMRSLLKEDGLFLLHTIGINRASKVNDSWINRYIFPNSYIPSPRLITAAMEGFFVLEDWQNFGADYDRTLMSWSRNFEESWPALSESYGDRFYRMWRYYLLSSAGGFRARSNQVWQVVLSPEGVPGVYDAPR